MKWLTEDKLSKKIFGLFSTCRTAPDRNIGTDDAPETMRGGQAVTHIWQIMPEAKVGGFGPLYLKHGALEQFAYTFITNGGEYVPKELHVYGEKNRNFVNSWLDYYGTDATSTNLHANHNIPNGFTVHYPPLESGLTHLIHGEVSLGKTGESFDNLNDAMKRLKEVKVPFIQVQVPVDKESINLQKTLNLLGYQAFLMLPGIMGKQSPLLWFGKVTEGVSVVPTFWDEKHGDNPFWDQELGKIGSQISNNWKK